MLVVPETKEHGRQLFNMCVQARIMKRNNIQKGSFNLYCMAIQVLNTVLWGCWRDFNNRLNGLIVYWCDVWPAGLCVSCSIPLIKVKVINAVFARL
jgi:hypothetical protein